MFQKYTKHKLTVWKIQSLWKWRTWLGCTKQWKSNARKIESSIILLEQIQILTLVPDKWSQMYCSEYFNVFEYLVWTSHKIKKVGGILAKPAPKKEKTVTVETLYLVTIVYEDDNFSRHVPEKKYYVNKSKGVHKQKPCNLQKSL